jgi:hypothetical protein
MAIGPASGEIEPVNDPQNNWPFARITYYYRQSEKPAGDWVCYAVMHSQTSEDQDLSDRVGRLLGVIRKALVDQTGYNALTDGVPFGVWLARHSSGEPGGEQEMWHNNIYFFDVTAKRSNIEWIREIAHEFSHLALPAIGGDYTDPEAWANGYYGERLLVRWLARGAAGGPAAVRAAFGGPFSGYVNFQRLLIDPYEGDFLKVGMNRAMLGRHDGLGMRYLIGMLLAIDDHSGPKVVGDLLWSLPQTALVDPLLLYSGAADALSRPAIAPAPPVDLSGDGPPAATPPSKSAGDAAQPKQPRLDPRTKPATSSGHEPPAIISPLVPPSALSPATPPATSTPPKPKPSGSDQPPAPSTPPVMAMPQESTH